jgi:hypothetical protein
MWKAFLVTTSLVLPSTLWAGTAVIDTPEVDVPVEVTVQEVAQETATVIAEVLPTVSIPALTEALTELSTVEPGSPEAAEVVATVIETVAAAADTATSIPVLTEAQTEVAVNILTTLISAAPAGSEARVKLEAIRSRLRAG